MTALHAQDALSRLLERSSFPQTDKQKIMGLFEQARKEDVPDPFLLPRLEEGLAKRIPGPALITVLKKELQFHLQARRLLLKADPAFRTESHHAIWQRAALCLAFQHISN